MKYTHFDDILPNRRTDFVMLYFRCVSIFTRATGRYSPNKRWQIDLPPSMLLRRIQYKFVQVVAHYKAHQHNDMPTIPNAKYPTGIVIDLKSSQENVFYLMGLA